MYNYKKTTRHKKAVFGKSLIPLDEINNSSISYYYIGSFFLFVFETLFIYSFKIYNFQNDINIALFPNILQEQIEYI